MNTPIVDMLTKYAALNATRMHMPSHKGKPIFGDFSKFDITELDFSDNLQMPTGVIAQSEQLFADLFGAKHAHYLVNGSTAGNLAMLAKAEGAVLITRSSHASVYNAVKLYGLTAYVLNDIAADGSTFCVYAADIIDTLKTHADIKTVLLTYPDYFGRCVDIKRVYEYTKANGIMLFVDSAHGAHFGLSPLLPPHAVNNSDACVVSTHKTLPALTQTAALLTNDDGLSAQLKKQINLLSTTSPSYLLLGSIDYAQGYARERAITAYSRLKIAVDNLVYNLPKGVTALPVDDFTRLVLDFSALNLSGKGVYDYLASKGVVAEFYYKSQVVFILSLMDDVNTLYTVLLAINRMPTGLPEATQNSGKIEFDRLTKLCFNDKGTCSVGIASAVGKRSAVNIGLTPPCTPIILDGESITQEKIDFMQSGGGSVFGIVGGKTEIYEE